MKILEVRFKNLNSLLGEWKIDFREPAYQDAGIFAIVGPTGAGKTTLFDAICLALFASTPRLGLISQGENGILSRQTADCFAEVTFETREGMFRSHFSQKRARGKVDGALQQPKRELVALPSARVLATKVSEVKTQTEAVTGMTFDRFTRSMLLAQGQFAAFLLADDKERGSILEQITGTEVYGELSIAAFQKSKEETDRLNQLVLDANAIELLSAEQRAQLEGERAACTESVRSLGERMEALHREERWLAELHRRVLELEMLEKERQAAMEALSAFEPEQQKLTWDAAARALKPLRDEVLQRTTEMERAEKRLHDLRLQESTLEAAKAQSEERATRAERAVAEVKDVIRQAEPGVRRARELDLLLVQAQRVELTLKKDRDLLQGVITALLVEHQERSEEARQLTNLLEEKETRLKEIQSDEALDQALSGILQCLGERERRAGVLEKAIELHTRALSRLESLKEEESQAKVAKDLVLKRELLLAEQALEIESAMAQLRGGASLESMLEDSARISETLEQSKEQKRRWDRLVEIEDELSERQDLVKAAEVDREVATQNHTRLIGTLHAAQQHLAEQEQAYRHAQQLQSYEDARRDLVPDAPCPLCGSLDHPYVQGLPTSESAVPGALEEARLKKEELDKEASAALKVCAQSEFALLHLEKELAKAKQRFDTEHRRSPTADADLAQSPKQQAEKLEIEIAQLKSRLEERRLTQSQILELEGRREELRATRDRTKEERAQADLDQQSVRKNRETAVEDRRRIEAETEEARRALAATDASLLAQLEPFGCSLKDAASPDALRQTLTARRDRFFALKQERMDLIERTRALQAKIHLLVTQQASEEAKDAQIAARLKDAEVEKARLVAERGETLKGEDADAFEIRHRASLEAAESVLTKEAKERATLTSQAAEIRATLRTEEEALARARPALQLAEAAWTGARDGAGLSSNQAYESALLPDAIRPGLILKAQQLKDDLQRLTLRCDDRTAELKLHRAEPLSDRDADRVRLEITSIEEQRTAALQAQGQVTERLLADDRRRQEAASKLERVEQQQAIQRKWHKLRTLIGSADGAVFRKFAQSLTFERVIGLANAQLRRMSDRYQLLRSRSTTEDLSLDVVDSYQASEVRPIKNLSGGESFLVSLALALGLSQMSSRSVRVDSLFLDEGFGTLDEETLEMALDALSSLHQEGKMIGVISHVAALKERIATRIEVRPSGFGRSILVGPGCTRTRAHEDNG